MASPLDRESLKKRISAFLERKILVVGDPVVDVYLHGTTHRISREAPVLIVREDRRERRLGGAANAAANLAELGAGVTLAGIVGKDEEGAHLLRLCKERHIETAALIQAEARCTVSKTRILAGGVHTTKQQMIRIDRENDEAPSPVDQARLTEAATLALDRADALIISDYGDGSLSEKYLELALRAKAQNKIVVVDSRFALKSYKGVTAITPNEPEAETSFDVEVERFETAAHAAEKIRSEMDTEVVLVTRGREGMAVSEQKGRGFLIPAHGPQEAVDVTGAGDTVTATFTLALASGASVLEAAVLANCAASVVVQEVGAACCTPKALAEALASFDPDVVSEIPF